MRCEVEKGRTVDATLHETMTTRLGSPQAHFINGGRTGAGRTQPVLDPATGSAITEVVLGGQSDVDAAVAAARAALPAWSAISPDERTRIMLRYADLIDEQSALFTELAIRDGGLTRMIAESCAMFSAMFIRYYAGWPSKITGETMPSAALGKPPADLLAYTLREPVGVVGAITPWNYPFGMEMLKIAPVLATGCTLVLKPAEEAPVAALFLAELAHEAGVPGGVFNVVNGLGSEAGAAISGHPDIDKVSFTGSTEVGRLIVQSAAGNLKKVSLELGGKSPVIVFPDADLETAVPGVAMAGFALSGQNCVCGSRLLVHESIAEPLAAGIRDFAKTLTVGPGTDAANAIGPLISERQRERVLGLIASATREGARLVAGGEAPARDGWFVEPTLFADCQPDMSLVRNEVFGPVIAMQTFSDSHSYEEIAAMANDTEYGLSGSVWTRDIKNAMRMTRLVNTGQIGVNCHAAMDPSMPFGGTKQSGWGQEFGAAAIELYTRRKAVTVTF